MRDIRAWLAGLGLERFAEAFEREQVTLANLPELTDADLKDLGLPLGPRKTILAARAEKPAPPPPLEVHKDSTPSPTRPEAQTERRQLTIMFCDLVGSTAMSQQLDPEALRELMRAYQQACGAVTEKYTGHVAQYLGDGLMVYFGWPRAHEDDAERAVRAALEILEAVKQVHGSEPLHVRIGIATGPVVVGETGAGDASVPKLAVGETPNLAARLQGLAGADEIVIAATTQRLVGGVFECADLGARTLKGIVDPVRAWRVAGLGRAEGRFEAAHGEGHLTPLVGRDEEIGLLLRRWEAARAGEGQLVSLGGEPGIGKSRIARALREAIEQEPHVRLRFQCSPFHIQSALHPVIEQVERAAGFSKDDSVEGKLDKLEALLRPGLDEGEIGDIFSLFAALLSLPVGRYAALNYSPQKQKERTLEALVSQVAGLSQQAPVLMVFEDAHWVDPTTQEMLDLLVPRLVQLPVLLLVTHRPEYIPHWSGEAHVTALTLNRLNRRRGAELTDRVTGGQTLPAEVLEQIVAKTDGVPLFVEELTKAVLESGIVRLGEHGYELTGPLTALAIPSTLQDSLMARLDRLSEVREVAQIGACIGREFPHDLLSAVSALPDDTLQAALGQLASAELIFQRGTPPDALYTFKHALVQDAAYASLLKSRRQVLHRIIAHALETRFPERVANEPEMAAHHCTAAGLHEQAVGYWAHAGRRAVERFANVEAIGHLSKGLELLQAVPAGLERDRKELLLQIDLGTALGASKGFTAPEVGRAYTRARELCDRVAEMPEMFSVLNGLYFYYTMCADHPSGAEIAGQTLALARRVEDSGAMVVGYFAGAINAFFMGDLQRAADLSEAGCGAYALAGQPSLFARFGFESGGACHDTASWTHWFLGYPERARRRSSESLHLAAALGHPYSTVMLTVHAALLEYWRWNAPAALAQARACAALAHETGIPVRQAEAHIVEGWALAELGDADEGVRLIQAGIEFWELAGTMIATAVWQAMLAEALGKAGRLDEAKTAVAKGLADVERTGEPLWEAELRRLEGEFLLADSGGDDQRAVSSFRTAIDASRRLNAKTPELRAATSLARLWHRQGKRVEAYDLLAPIYGWFTEGFDAKDLIEAKAVLSSLLPARPR